jgi:hypothetical protein
MAHVINCFGVPYGPYLVWDDINCSPLLFSSANDVINGGFTDWSAWSACSSNCGKRSLRSRERYCTNPSPSNGGADCDGERFQLTLCKVVSCSSAVTSRPKPRHGKMYELYVNVLFHKAVLRAANLNSSRFPSMLIPHHASKVEVKYKLGSSISFNQVPTRFP